MGLFSNKKTVNDNSTYNAKIIQSYLQESGTNMGFMSSGAVKAAAQLLRSNEEIKYAICANVAVGTMGGKLKAKTYKFKNKVNGVVVITNQRVVFATSVLGDSDNVSIYLTDIDSIDSAGNNLTGAVLRIQSRSSALAIDGNRKILNPFRDKIDEALYLSRETPNSTTVIQQSSGADEILKYKRLMDEGIITAEEFNAKKKQILGL